MLAEVAVLSYSKKIWKLGRQNAQWQEEKYIHNERTWYFVRVFRRELKNLLNGFRIENVDEVSMHC